MCFEKGSAIMSRLPRKGKTPKDKVLRSPRLRIRNSLKFGNGIDYLGANRLSILFLKRRKTAAKAYFLSANLTGRIFDSLTANPQGRFIGIADLLRRGVVDQIIICNVWGVRCA